jgi:uncharacterized protein YdcH (DUF465 family)
MDGNPTRDTQRRDYPPSLGSFDSARQPHWEELPMERNAQEESKAHLMATSEEFRQLAGQHSDFARKLDDLESLPHLTEEQQLEEIRLKKLKLRLKDQMEAMVSHNRPQHVA